jgi:hypothetical protein
VTLTGDTGTLSNVTTMTTLPRLQLFELEDQPRFPATIRDLATDYIHFLETKFALHRPAVRLMAEALQFTKATRLIDLCSGGGGSIAALLQALAADGITPHVTLTDRFPNLRAFHRAAEGSNGQISFHPEPVDARAVPAELHGFRTMFNAFHHFSPTTAIDVLCDAVRAREPIGVFEIPDRRWSTLLSLLVLTPLLVAAMTPFIRPFCWRRLLWTYVVPLVPLTCWWDGIASQLRAYSVSELQSLTRATEAGDYTWRFGRVPIVSTPGYLTYLIGSPRESEGAQSDPMRTKTDVEKSGTG